jgi:CBS domain-containing protein
MKTKRSPTEIPLSEVMSRAVITLDPEDSLRTAMGVLMGSGISGAPVVGDGMVVGVLSSTDILDFASNPPPAPERQESDGEGWELAEGWEDGDEEAMPPAYFAVLWAGRKGQVPTHMEGVMPEWDLLGDYTVAEIMTRRVLALPPAATLGEAAALMVRADVHRLLVMEDDELCGVVSSMDVMRAFAG